VDSDLVEGQDGVAGPRRPVSVPLDRRIAFALLYAAVVLSTTECWLLPFRAPATLPQRLALPLDQTGTS
jgi:hypothetical protein